MARRDTLWSFFVFCHPEAADPMTCVDKLWSFHTPFRHSDTVVSDGTQRQIMVILRLFSSRGGEPDDIWRQIMVIPHKFSPSGDDRVRWHAETNYGHSTPFCDPEAVSPMTCRDKLWLFHTPFRHPEMIVSDDTQIQIMVILRLLSSRGGEPNDMRRNHMVPHLFHCPETIKPDCTRRQIMIISHTFSPFGDNHV